MYLREFRPFFEKKKKIFFVFVFDMLVEICLPLFWILFPAHVHQICIRGGTLWWNGMSESHLTNSECDFESSPSRIRVLHNNQIHNNEPEVKEKKTDNKPFLCKFQSM